MSASRPEIQPLDLESFAAQLIASTKERVYIRPEDGLLILRPNQLHYLNATAAYMLARLYEKPEAPDVEGLIEEVSARYRVERSRVRRDLLDLLQGLAALLNDRLMGVPGVRITPLAPTSAACQCFLRSR